MSTLRPRILLSALLALGLAPPALAQERPNGMSEADYQARKRELKDEIDRYEADLARFREDASGFEGVWQVSGSRTYFRGSSDNAQVGEFAGEVVIQRDGEELKVEGKVAMVGRRGARWEGRGAVEAGGWTLRTRFDSTIGRVGQATYALEGDGSLKIQWASDEQAGERPRARGEGTAVRVFDLDRGGLEARLFALNKQLQYLRYPRPEPTEYDARSGDVSLRFTPTVELDPDGVEQQVLDIIAELGEGQTLDLCLFEFSLPRVARALIAAQERGVRVRMVYDSREDEQPAIHMLKEANVPMRGDERSALMHNKFLVIDGKRVWTGSTNLAPGGIYVADNHAFTFGSEAMAALYTAEFEEMFVDGAFGPTSPANTDHTPIRIDRWTSVEVYFAPEDNAMDRVVEVVRSAQRSIKIIAFAYTSDALFDAMAERMAAGVRVSGIFESRHAGWADIKIGPLHSLGAEVRFDRNPNALHHKVLVIDDKITISGSFNFSDSADRSNDENMLVIDSGPVARAFGRELQSLMSVADPDDPRIATSGMEAHRARLAGEAGVTAGGATDEPGEAEGTGMSTVVDESGDGEDE